MLSSHIIGSDLLSTLTPFRRYGAAMVPTAIGNVGVFLSGAAPGGGCGYGISLGIVVVSLHEICVAGIMPRSGAKSIKRSASPRRMTKIRTSSAGSKRARPVLSAALLQQPC
jgi:hypothetical protein